MISMETSVDRWVLGFAYVGATFVCIGLVVAAWAAWDHICERLGMKREELRCAVAEMRQNESEAFKAIDRWRPAGVDLVSEIHEMVNTLQAQAKENEELRSLLERASEALMDGLGDNDLRTLLTDIDTVLHPENGIRRMRYEDLGQPLKENT